MTVVGNAMDGQLPLSLQIYKAHTDWNKLRHEYDILDGMKDVLKARKIEERVETQTGLSFSRAEGQIRASEWYEEYLGECADAKRKMLDAQAKHAYLVNLSLEQRDEGYHERFTARL